ncbi:MAG: B12-binding domain-containing radical SAM protein [Planctomycetota bacterium]
MELPSRARGDQLLPDGALRAKLDRLCAMSGHHDLATVIINAFDWRTRMLPFFWSDIRMVPAGVRALGSALSEAGFDKTRIVLQQWSRHVQPSRLRLDGRIPDLLLISSMQIHSAEAQRLLADANRIPVDKRPLVMVGGPKFIYQPWDAFSDDPENPVSADAAVTGEEFVLLDLLEALLSRRNGDEPIRRTFLRARDRGELADIAGLVYAPGQNDSPAEQLIDTGVQRLVRNLDELPHPVHAFRLLEPPGRQKELRSQPLPPERVRKHNHTTSLVLTFGCHFGCPYCPIPAYNQRQYRVKSGGRIADEMTRLYHEYGLDSFFGADDNFFNDEKRTVEIAKTLARAEVDGKPLRHKIHWATEVTVHDTLRMANHVNLVRRAGVWALWMGVEDMTGSLVKKGQTVDRTREAFHLLRDRGICPMPMMMHHDSQPLYTRGKPDGLLNQVRLLRQAGAVTMQVLMLTPACGSRIYEETHSSGLVLESAGGRQVEERMFDGNYVIASKNSQPWRKQLNLFVAYAYFYNPYRFLRTLLRRNTRAGGYEPAMQAVGMFGLLQNVRRTLGWAVRLMTGKRRRKLAPPVSSVPMRSPRNGPAAHDLLCNETHPARTQGTWNGSEAPAAE